MIGKLLAEAIGTFWLVLGGCGSAVLAAAYPDLGIGFVGVALAFGLTVLTMAAAIGHISGCHLNPAVTAGLVASGRVPAKDLIPYWVAQVVGGIGGAGILYLVAKGLPGFDAGAWFGISAPAGTPKEIVAKLNAEINKALLSQEVKDRLTPLAAAPLTMTPDVKDEREKWGKLVRDSGARVD